MVSPATVLDLHAQALAVGGRGLGRHHAHRVIGRRFDQGAGRLQGRPAIAEHQDQLALMFNGIAQIRRIQPETGQGFRRCGLSALPVGLAGELADFFRRAGALERGRRRFGGAGVSDPAENARAAQNECENSLSSDASPERSERQREERPRPLSAKDRLASVDCRISQLLLDPEQLIILRKPV